MNKREKREQKRQQKLAKQAKKKQQKQLRNAQKHKGENMFGFGSSKNKNSVKTYSYGYNRGTVPTTGKETTTLSTVLFRQSTLDKIGEICLPAADESEFQVHYRSLQLIISKAKEDQPATQRLVVTIPTVFFNMPQKVSRASVDFSLDEVASISEQVAPVSEALAEKYLKAFPIEFFEAQGFTVEARETEIGSMHRHPGNFGFSGTDLDNKAENPGVIFRTRGAKDRIQVDSVMYIPNKRVTLNTTETRVIDVAPVENGIEGTYLRTPTWSYIIDDTEPPEDFGSFFGRKEQSADIEFTTDKDSITDEYPEMKELFKNFLNEIEDADGYSPVLIIDPNLIEESYSYYNHGGTTYGGYGQRAGQTTHPTRNLPVKGGSNAAVNRDVDTYNSYYDEYQDADTYGDGWDSVYAPASDDHQVGVHQTLNTEAPAPMRPTWRKVQALGVLTSTYGIDVNNNSNIDGSGSVKDVKSIIVAMTAKGHTGVTIDAFFEKAAYTTSMLEAANKAD